MPCREETEESEVATCTVGQILKVLRRKFAEVTLLPGHAIEIYNQHGQYLGRVSFRYGRDSYLPKGTRKVTDETEVSGFHLEEATGPYPGDGGGRCGRGRL